MPALKSRTALLRLLLVAVLGATAALPAAAQWKWKDKAGQTQYSDIPPPAGTPDADILQRPTQAAAPRPAAPPASGAAAPALAPPKGVDPELEAKRKKAEADAAAKKRVEDEKTAMAKLDNCSRARANLNVIDSGQRISRVNAQGEREYLDDQARAAEAQRMRTIIASDCK
jgi:Domain of unknown function (DUF4124)